jgi:hypothetical protein
LLFASSFNILAEIRSVAMAIDGGCLCGQVRYHSDSSPLFTALCHCTHCQKQSGSAFSIIVAVKARSLEILGDIKAFSDKGGDDRAVSRQFCPTCGSALFTVGDGAPGVTFIKAGTLDDTAQLEPTMALWCESRQPWVKLDVPLRQFDRQPQN